MHSDIFAYSVYFVFFSIICPFLFPPLFVCNRMCARFVCLSLFIFVFKFSCVYFNMLELIIRIEIHRFILMIAVASEFLCIFGVSLSLSRALTLPIPILSSLAHFCNAQQKRANWSQKVTRIYLCIERLCERKRASVRGSWQLQNNCQNDQWTKQLIWTIE